MMNKIKIIFVLILSFLLFFSCTPVKNEVKQQTPPQPAQPEYPKITVLDTMPGPVPNFISKPQLYVEKDTNTNEMFLYIWVNSRGQSLDGTKAVLRAQAYQRIAEGIKLLITSQLSYAMRGDKNVSDEYVESAVAAVAKNVKVTGFIQVMEWWRWVAYQETKDSSIQKFFDVYMLFRMPYEEYKKARDEALKAFYQQNKPKDPALVDKAQSLLQKLDDEATMMEWNNNF
ncbi:MAG: hypothetical protein N3A58_01595 [Spirochaetes bacterium]|nr:hypothetical protein [Spirochaetota bacterium]